MDLQGEKNGLETAAALGDAYGVIPLFVTGHTDYRVRAMALPIEPLGYLTKPFRPEEMLAALTALS